MPITTLTAALDAGHVELAALRLVHGLLTALAELRATSGAALDDWPVDSYLTGLG